MTKLIRSALLAACFVLITHGAALACMEYRSLDPAIQERAEVILRGRLLSYEVAGEGVSAIGIARIEAIEINTGPRVRLWEFRYNPNFGVPTVWLMSENVVLAGETLLDEAGRAVLYFLQDGCAPAFVLDDTEANRALVPPLRLASGTTRWGWLPRD